MLCIATDVWSPEVIVTENILAELPDDCGSKDVAERLVAFIQAFNRGDTGQLSQFFGSEFA